MGKRWNNSELREVIDNMESFAVSNGDAVVMDLHDERVLVDLSSLGATDTATLTLPSVVAARGKIYSIRMTAAVGAAGGALTIQDAGDADVSYSEASLDAANDRVVLYSDGYLWHVLSSTIA